MDEQRPCVFCSVLQGKIPAKVVYEDENSVAFLDIHPRSRGMTIIIPRLHFAEATDNPQVSQKIFESAMIVSEMIKRSLSPQTISLSVIPSREIPHFHIRIYPVTEGEVPLIENQPRQVDERELDEIANRIRQAMVFVPKPKNEEPVQEKSAEEDSRSKEDIAWIRKQVERD